MSSRNNSGTTITLSPKSLSKLAKSLARLSNSSKEPRKVWSLFKMIITSWKNSSTMQIKTTRTWRRNAANYRRIALGEKWLTEKVPKNHQWITFSKVRRPRKMVTHPVTVNSFEAQAPKTSKKSIARWSFVPSSSKDARGIIKTDILSQVDSLYAQ